MVSLIGTSSVMAHTSYRKVCSYQYDGWGRRVKICRTEARNHHHRHSRTGDVVAGAVVGAAAGAMVASCAPEVVDGNVNATEKVLMKLIAEPGFGGEEQFKKEVNRIAKIRDVKTKVSEYFKMVDVNTSEDIAHFAGARDEDYSKYADSLADNTGLSQDNAMKVVDSLIVSLKGSLR